MARTCIQILEGDVDGGIDGVEHTLCFSRSSVEGQYKVQYRSFLIKIHTLRERSAHDHATDAGWSGEVSLAALSPAGRQAGVDLGHFGG